MANSNLQRKLCKRCLALKSTKGCEQDEKSKVKVPDTIKNP